MAADGRPRTRSSAVQAGKSGENGANSACYPVILEGTGPGRSGAANGNELMRSVAVWNEVLTSGNAFVGCLKSVFDRLQRPLGMDSADAFPFPSCSSQRIDAQFGADFGQN